MLLMRLQGMEQEVCQLFFATLCRKIDSKWQGFAGNCGKAAKLGGLQGCNFKMWADAMAWYRQTAEFHSELKHREALP
ncbi:hypothetical protein B9Z46_10565 [Limnohabitans sp. Hippo4]|nr:hypothetical protein B9Z46_10565 [Limnohabitans sp. Hippo4]